MRRRNGRRGLQLWRPRQNDGVRFDLLRVLSHRNTSRRLFASSQGYAVRGRDHEGGLDLVDL